MRVLDILRDELLDDMFWNKQDSGVFGVPFVPYVERSCSNL